MLIVDHTKGVNEKKKKNKKRKKKKKRKKMKKMKKKTALPYRAPSLSSPLAELFP